MNEKVLHNCIVDFTKEEIDKFERARLVKDYMELHNISQRELAKRFNKPHSTIQDWLIWNRIEEEEYNEEIKNGTPHLAIYRGLRKNKKAKSIKSLKLNRFILDSNIVLNNMKKYSTSFVHDNSSYDSIMKLKDLINRIEMKFEKDIKNKK